MNTNTLLYGSPAPLPEQIPLRAGPLSMLFENGDLRYLRLGETEAVRRIYAAARDRDWGTAPNVLSDLQMDIRSDAFDITFACTNRHRDIDFVWRGALRGTADGVIVCEFDGVAQADFLRARLGFCVLHPIGVSGKPARIEQTDGTRIAARFPTRIAPQQVVDSVIKPVPKFEEMRAITCQITRAAALTLAFEGDIFEMEDQRNWTDGSFKTYCTPLRLPWPVLVTAGTRVRQRITLSVTGAAQDSRARKPKPLTVRIGNTAAALPKIGLAVNPAGRLPSAANLARLRALKPEHLRVDVPLRENGWRARLTRAAIEARALRCPLEIALFTSENAAGELATYAAWAKTRNLAIARYLVFDKTAPATPTALVALARAQLGKKVPIFAGTNKFFTELNRNRPDARQLALVDGLVYSFNPQVHAFDNTSLAEAPEAQAETLRSCAAFAQGRGIAVSGITLKARHSLSDNGPEPRERYREHDTRQGSLFGAAWTAASLGQIARARRAASITLFETTGPRGVLDAKRVFPLYHVLADVMAFGGDVVMSASSDPLKVESIVLRAGNRLRVVLANMTAQTQSAQITGLPSRTRVRIMDAGSGKQAMHAPEAWRKRVTRSVSGNTFTLAPYAVVRIDTRIE